MDLVGAGRNADCGYTGTDWSGAGISDHRGDPAASFVYEASNPGVRAVYADHDSMAGICVLYGVWPTYAELDYGGDGVGAVGGLDCGRGVSRAGAAGGAGGAGGDLPAGAAGDGCDPGRDAGGGSGDGAVVGCGHLIRVLRTSSSLWHGIPELGRRHWLARLDVYDSYGFIFR